MVKVAVLGAAGGIGQPLSLLLKANLPAGSTLHLSDIANVNGVCCDLSHISTDVQIRSFTGADELPECLLGCQLVIIPAGVPRKPGMTRDDLFNVNAGIVAGLVAVCARVCPDALLALITNPVNSVVPIAVEVLKKAGAYNPRKVFGVSTLDIVRTKTFVGELVRQRCPGGRTVRELDDVLVVGGHSGNTIIPLLSQVQAACSLSAEDIAALTTRVQNAGTEVVEAKQGAGSATLSMAYAALVFANHLVQALEGTPQRVCAYVPTQDHHDRFYGLPYFALPVVVGPAGIQEWCSFEPVSENEQQLITACIPELQASINQGIDFVAQWKLPA